MFAIGTYTAKTSLYAQDAQNKYEDLTWKYALYPKISDLGNFESLEYHHIWSYGFIFSWDTDYFIYEYNTDEYQIKKEMLEETLFYQHEPLSLHGYTIEPTITLNGYTFTMLSFQYDMLSYPKSIFFIITNDETKEIGYMWYVDNDIDYVSSLKQLILDDSGWKYIR